jgi:23S rRNA G2445 N2-methylase RlmL
VERALQARLPKLRLVDDDADAEFWLTLVGDCGLVALRLSTPGMRQGRHRPASVPASLKPTVARAMVRLSGPRETDVVLDPFCGAGTLLLERAHAGPFASLIGGDRDPATVAVARTNVRASGLPVEISEWDARALPLPDRSVDVVLSNPPFGKKIRIEGGAADPFYREFLAEARRVLRPAWASRPHHQPGRRLHRGGKQLSPPLAVTTQVPLLVRGERAVVFVATTPSAAVAASAKGSPRRKDSHGSVQLPDPGTP